VEGRTVVDESVAGWVYVWTGRRLSGWNCRQVEVWMCGVP
jgi:hypothetical protein